MPSPDPTALVARVLAHANDVHLIARRCTRPDLADALTAEAARWQDEAVTIVVAGAQKRGKSRLLNAMLDRPGLLPVDVDIATQTHLTLRHGPALTATVLRTGDGGEVNAHPIDPDDIAEYASMLGDPAKRRGVAGVELTLDHPLLAGVRLADTPGVDSLTIGHRHTTMAILQEADALLFAVSAQDQPILRHELEFLADAAQRIHAVAFVLTKVEDSTSWRELLAENQQRLARFVADNDHAELRRLLSAPWIPVSAKLAEAAQARRQAGQHERAAELQQRSGFDQLAAYIRSCAARRELTRCGRVLAAATGAVRSLTAAEEDRLLASADDPDAIEQRRTELQADLDRLAERSRVRRRLSVAHQLLGREVSATVRTRLDGIRKTYDQAINELNSKKSLERYADELPESIERSLTAARAELLHDAYATVSAGLADLLRELELDPEQLRITARSTTAEVPIDGIDRAGRQKFDGMRDGLPAGVMAVSLGGVMAHVIGLTALSAIAWPVALVAGPALAAGMVLRRRSVERTARDQAAMKRSVAEIFAAAATDLALAVERTITEWRTEMDELIDETIAMQRRDLENRRREIQTLATRDAATRQEAATSARDRMRSLVAAGSRGEELARALDAERTGDTDSA